MRTVRECPWCGWDDVLGEGAHRIGCPAYSPRRLGEPGAEGSRPEEGDVTLCKWCGRGLRWSRLTSWTHITSGSPYCAHPVSRDA